jgi:hypothetical protein
VTLSWAPAFRWVARETDESVLATYYAALYAGCPPSVERACLLASVEQRLERVARAA